MRRATGIPPHISHSIEIEKVLAICGEVKGAVEKLDETIKTSIENAIDGKVESEGNVNLTILNKAFKAFKLDILGDLQLSVRPERQSPSGEEPAIDTEIIVADGLTFK